MKDILAGGISRHAYTAVSDERPTKPYTDTRPRVEYRLPSGDIIRFIVDHDQIAPPTITYQLAGGRIVTAVRS